MYACLSCHCKNASAIYFRCRTRKLPRVVLACGKRRSANRNRWALNRLKPQGDGPGWGPDDETVDEVMAIAEQLYQDFMEVDTAAAYNLGRVQSAMCKHKVGPHCFAGSTGYGHGDIGRATFDQVFAEVQGTEASMARVSMAGADHALSCALFACLRPRDHVTFLTGEPDPSTKQLVQGAAGSLEEWGISYSHVAVAPDGAPDMGAFAKEFSARPPRAVVLQRAPSLTPSVADARRCFLSLRHLSMCLSAIQQQFSPDECPVVIVDNRHSEFVEPQEPGALGVDLVTGTFLSCLGGSIVPSGGYVAGRRTFVEKACSQFSAPGMSLDAGAVPGDTLRLLYQGLFLAPGTVSEAQKGSLLLHKALSIYGAQVPLKFSEVRTPFINMNAGSEETLQALLDIVNDFSCFPQELPRSGSSAVDVWHAGGGFVQGCYAEVGASGVMHEPFPCVLYGGTHWSQWVNILAQLCQTLKFQTPQHSVTG